MRKVSAFSFMGLMIISPLCIAQSVFNGTWRPDPQIFSPTRQPDDVELAHGVYACKTCVPPYTVKADGHDQALSGNPYYDSISVKANDDHTVTKTA